MRRKDQNGCVLPSFQLQQDAIPPVSAGGVRAAADMVVGYAERRGLTTDDVVDLLAMLRINADTLENGLYATEALGGAA